MPFLLIIGMSKKILIFDISSSSKMSRGIILLLLIYLGTGVKMFSQQLSHQVIISGGGIVSNQAVDYSQTVGESITEIISSSDFTLTQGFQQPSVKFTNENSPQGNGVNVYPNPATDYIKVELFGDFARIFHIEMVSINGTLKKVKDLSFTDKFWHTEELKINDLPTGIYLIRVKSQDGVINRIFKIEKL